jgi:hypothetical protein
MARQVRTTKTGWDRTATLDADGYWEWSTGKLRWTWINRVGLNLSVHLGDDPCGSLYAKTLREASLVAEGFEAGWLARDQV